MSKEMSLKVDYYDMIKNITCIEKKQQNCGVMSQVILSKNIWTAQPSIQYHHLVTVDPLEVLVSRGYKQKQISILLNICTLFLICNFHSDPFAHVKKKYLKCIVLLQQRKDCRFSF